MSALESRTERASAEEQAARLFEAHADEILAYCRRHLPSSAEAEDAQQTTFLYALRALRRGVEPECEAAWLTAIAKNVCSTQRRTLARHGVVDVDLDRIALARPEPEEVELLAALPDALAALPERQRNALVMREWQGLGAGEIASRLQLTPTATCALLTRARRSLASALTTPGRTRSALSPVFLLGLVRSQLRALLGSVAAKTAVTTVAATVAAGVVVAEQSVHAPAPAVTRAATAAAPAVRSRSDPAPAVSSRAKPVAHVAPHRVQVAATVAATTAQARARPARPTTRSAPSSTTPSADPAAPPPPSSAPPSADARPSPPAPTMPIPPVAPPAPPPVPALPVTVPVVELPLPPVTTPELPSDPPVQPPASPLP